MSETILNDDFDFSAAPYEVKNAFQGWPRKIRLESNERLFRMLTTEDSTRCGSSVLSGQWWFDLDTRMQLSQVSHQSGSYSQCPFPNLRVSARWILRWVLAYSVSVMIDAAWVSAGVSPCASPRSTWIAKGSSENKSSSSMARKFPMPRPS